MISGMTKSEIIQHDYDSYIDADIFIIYVKAKHF